MTKISSSLPKEYEDDGLGSINKDLIDHPHETHVVIAIIDCKSITHDVDKGYEIATARILQIEPMKDPAADERARDLLLAAQERRTGRQALPLPGVEVADLNSGEVFSLRTSTGYWPPERAAAARTE
jgi:hypothetical protein